MGGQWSGQDPPVSVLEVCHDARHRHLPVQPQVPPDQGPQDEVARVVEKFCHGRIFLQAVWMVWHGPVPSGEEAGPAGQISSNYM